MKAFIECTTKQAIELQQLAHPGLRTSLDPIRSESGPTGLVATGPTSLILTTANCSAWRPLWDFQRVDTRDRFPILGSKDNCANGNHVDALRHVRR